MAEFDFELDAELDKIIEDGLARSNARRRAAQDAAGGKENSTWDLVDAFTAGRYGVAADVSSGIAAISRDMGFDETARDVQSYSDYQRASAEIRDQNNRLPSTTEEVENIGDLVDLTLNTAARSIPHMASPIAGAIVGSAVGGPVGAVGGAFAGGTAGGVPQKFGGYVEEQRNLSREETGIPTHNTMTALPAAIVTSATDVVGGVLPGVIRGGLRATGKMAAREASSQFKPGSWAARGESIAKRGGRMGAEEGVTEAIDQAMLEQIKAGHSVEGYKPDMGAVAEAGKLGALTGVAMGGGAATVTKTDARLQEIRENEERDAYEAMMESARGKAEIEEQERKTKKAKEAEARLSEWTKNLRTQNEQRLRNEEVEQEFAKRMEEGSRLPKGTPFEVAPTGTLRFKGNSYKNNTLLPNENLKKELAEAGGPNTRFNTQWEQNFLYKLTKAFSSDAPLADRANELRTFLLRANQPEVARDRKRGVTGDTVRYGSTDPEVVARREQMVKRAEKLVDDYLEVAAREEPMFTSRRQRQLELAALVEERVRLKNIGLESAGIDPGTLNRLDHVVINTPDQRTVKTAAREALGRELTVPETRYLDQRSTLRQQDDKLVERIAKARKAATEIEQKIAVERARYEATKALEPIQQQVTAAAKNILAKEEAKANPQPEPEVEPETTAEPEPVPEPKKEAKPRTEADELATQGLKKVMATARGQRTKARNREAGRRTPAELKAGAALIDTYVADAERLAKQERGLKSAQSKGKKQDATRLTKRIKDLKKKMAKQREKLPEERPDDVALMDRSKFKVSRPANVKGTAAAVRIGNKVWAGDTRQDAINNAAEDLNMTPQRAELELALRGVSRALVDADNNYLTAEEYNAKAKRAANQTSQAPTTEQSAPEPAEPEATTTLRGKRKDAALDEIARNPKAREAVTEIEVREDQVDADGNPIVGLTGDALVDALERINRGELDPSAVSEVTVLADMFDAQGNLIQEQAAKPEPGAELIQTLTDVFRSFKEEQRGITEQMQEIAAGKGAKSDIPARRQKKDDEALYDEVAPELNRRLNDDDDVKPQLTRTDNAPGLPVETVKGWVKGMVSTLDAPPRVVVADSRYVNADPEVEAVRRILIRRYGRDGQGRVRSNGVYTDGAGGIAVIFADNAVSKDDVAATAWHEIFGHAGLRRLFKDDLVRKLQEMIDTTPRLRDMATDFLDDMRGTTGGSYTDKQLVNALEEVFAEGQETGATFDTTQYPVFTSAFQDLRAWLRGLIRDLVGGYVNIEYNDNEIKSILSQARRVIVTGEDTRTIQAITKDNTNAQAYNEDPAVPSPNTSPDGDGYSTLEDLAYAIQVGDVRSSEVQKRKAFLYAGKLVADSGSQAFDLALITTDIDKVKHAVAMTRDGTWLYDPQFNVWMTPEVYSDAIGGYKTDYILSQNQVLDIKEKTKFWPSHATAEAKLNEPRPRSERQFSQPTRPVSRTTSVVAEGLARETEKIVESAKGIVKTANGYLNRNPLAKQRGKLAVTREAKAARVKDHYTALSNSLERLNILEPRLQNMLDQANQTSSKFKAKTQVAGIQRRLKKALSDVKRTKGKVQTKLKSLAKNSPLNRVSEFPLQAEGLVPVPRAREIIENMTKRWTNAPKFIVVNSQMRYTSNPALDSKLQEVIDEVGVISDTDQRIAAKGTTTNIDGEDVILIYSDRISSEQDLVATVWHEALGHMGLRTAFGKELENMMRQLVRTSAWFRKLAEIKADEMAVPQSTPGSYTIDELVLPAEEVLAEMGETNPDSKTPMNQEQTEPLYNKIKHMIKRFARRMGWLDAEFTQAEVWSIIMKGREAITSGPVSQNPVINPELNLQRRASEISLADAMAGTSWKRWSESLYDNWKSKAEKGLYAVMGTHDVAAFAQRHLGESAQKFVDALTANQQIENQRTEFADTVLRDAEGLTAAQRRQVSEYLMPSTLDKKWGYAPDWHPGVRSGAITVDPKMAKMWNAMTPHMQRVADGMLRHGYETRQQLETLIDEARKETLLKGLTQEEFNQLPASERQRRQQQSFRQQGKFLQKLGSPNDPYVPLMRFGEYVVAGKSQTYLDTQAALKDATGAARTRLKEQLDKLREDADHYYITFAPDKGQANEIMEAMSKEGGPLEGKLNWQVYTKREELNEFGGAPWQLMSRMREALAIEQDDISTAAYKEIDTAMAGIYMEMLAEHSIRRRDQSRMNVAGASEDIFRAFAEKARMDARFLANVSKRGEITKAITEMKTKVKESPFGTNDRDTRQKLVNELLKRYVNSLQAPGPWNELEQKMMLASSVYHLLLMPRYYIQNATQTYMMSAPYIAAKHKFAPAYGTIAKKYEQVAKGFARQDMSGLAKGEFITDKIFDLEQDANGEYRKDGEGNYIFKNKDDERRADMLHSVKDSGDLDVGLSFELGRWGRPGAMFEATTPAGKAAAGVGTMFDKGILYLTSATRQVEVLNRTTAALAAYDLEYAASNLTDPEAKHEQAVKYAREVLKKTQFDYSTLNAPRVFNNLPRVTTQFRKYQVYQISLIVGSIYNSIVNDPTLKTAEEQQQAKVVARYMLGALAAQTAAVTGALGLPFAGLLVGISEMVLSDEDEPFDAESYLSQALGGDTWVARLLLRGAPAAAGADVSAAIGMEHISSILPFAISEGESKEGAYALIGQAFGGAFGGMVVDTVEAYNTMQRGDYWKATEQLMPGFIGATLKTVREQINEGVSNRSGDILVKPEDFSTASVILSMLGLTTSEMAAVYRARSLQYRYEQQFNERTAYIRKEFVRARKEKNFQRQEELRDAWVKLQKTIERTYRNSNSPRKAQTIADLYKAPRDAEKREQRNVDRFETFRDRVF